MNSNDLTDVGALFTRNGKDVWRLESWFDMPSCTMRNIESGEKETFGMGGHTADSFKALVVKE